MNEETVEIFLKLFGKKFELPPLRRSKPIMETYRKQKSKFKIGGITYKLK